jgi:tetratricopeptide (TPR) repeat protein
MNNVCPHCRKPLVKTGEFWFCDTHGKTGDKLSLDPLRIFISYGHDNNEGLVRRIYEDLKKRGHDVWFDKTDIKFGEDWRREITENIVNSNRVLSFLSKYATRDPGVCLDEIAIAIGVKGGNVQTILVESEAQVHPPPSISYIQWLDMHNWKDGHGNVSKCDKIAVTGDDKWESWYDEKLSEIVDVVESDESRRFAGEIETLNRYLKPISSNLRISKLLQKGFIGRSFMFEVLEQWRSNMDSDSRLFLIKGEAGMGKSAFAAHLTHYGKDKVVAAQFVEWDKPDHRNAKRIVCSLAFQLATRLPDYRKLLLTLPEISILDNKNPDELFDYLIAGPLHLVIHGGRERLLIVIDAIDEATEFGHNPLVEMLARYASSLPEWLGIILTYRPDETVETAFKGLAPLVLDKHSQNNYTDICEYLNIALKSKLEIRDDAETIIEQIFKKSEGIFLYIEKVCQEIMQGSLSLDQLDCFPRGLGGIFYDYFTRQFPNLAEFRNNIRPVLSSILAAREPIPIDSISKICNLNDDILHDYLQSLGSIFPVSMESGREVIKPYHKSLADWLNEKSLSGSYWCSIKTGYSLLADFCWEEYKSGVNRMSDYSYRHMAFHLSCVEDWDKLMEVVNDFDLAYFVRWSEQGSYLEGIQVITGITNYLKNNGIESVKNAGMLTQLARFYNQDGNYDEAKKYLHEALLISSGRSGRKVKAIALHELGSLYLYEDDLVNVKRYYQKALNICLYGFPAINDEAAANLIGLSILARRMSFHHHAKHLAEKALHRADLGKDVFHQIAAHRTVAVSLKDELKYEEAEKYLMQAELISTAIKAYRDSLANYEAFGWLYFEKSLMNGQWSNEAENYFVKAVAESEKHGLSSCVLDARLGLAWCALYKNELESSKTRYLEANSAIKRRSNRIMAIELMVLEAGIALQSGEFERAEHLYRELIDLCRLQDVPGEGAVAWSGLGAVCWISHKVIQAEEAWSQARLLSKRCSKARSSFIELGIERLIKGTLLAPY